MASWDEWSAQSTAVSHCHHLINNLQEASCMKGLKLLLLETNTWKTTSRWVILLVVQFHLAQGRHFRELPQTELTNQSFLLLVAFLNIPLSLELVVKYKQEQSQKALCLLQRKVTIYTMPSQLFPNEELNFQYPSWQVILEINFTNYCFQRVKKNSVFVNSTICRISSMFLLLQHYPCGSVPQPNQL